MKPIFDAHLDLAWNALSWGRDLARELATINAAESAMSDHVARGRATVSLPEMRRAGVAVCLATVQARVRPDAYPADGYGRLGLDYPTREAAFAVGQGQLAYYGLLEDQGQVTILRTASDLAAHWDRWQHGPNAEPPVGLILAMEGADPIVNPAQAEAWWRQGMRAVSLAHYGPSAYAVGTGASGPLSPEGIELLAEFRRLGMVLDVTHLAEPGFSEALDRFDGPVMASHNNCRALVPGDRQFSDEQLRRLVDRDVVIGVAMDAWMLWPGWRHGSSSGDVVGLEAVADHVDHICQLAGNVRHVGIGSDLDGGYGTEQTPRDLETIADLGRLGQILAGRGYGDRDVDAVFHGNWIDFFGRQLPP